MSDRVGASYLTDVSDEEWDFVLPYLLLSREDNRSRKHALRASFNGVRYIVKTGNQWRLMPHDLPPWEAVYQQMRRSTPQSVASRGPGVGWRRAVLRRWWPMCRSFCVGLRAPGPPDAGVSG